MDKESWAGTDKVSGLWETDFRKRKYVSAMLPSVVVKRLALARDTQGTSRLSCCLLYVTFGSHSGADMFCHTSMTQNHQWLPERQRDRLKAIRVHA